MHAKFAECDVPSAKEVALYGLILSIQLLVPAWRRGIGSPNLETAQQESFPPGLRLLMLAAARSQCTHAIG